MNEDQLRKLATELQEEIKIPMAAKARSVRVSDRLSGKASKIKVDINNFL